MADELDALFSRLREDLREDILASVAESRRHTEDLVAESRRYTDAQVAEARRHSEEQLAETRRYSAAVAAENRRFFQAIAEDLMSRIQLVAEGVTAVDQKLDRFREEVRGEFAVVDRRLLRLEARVSALEGRS